MDEVLVKVKANNPGERWRLPTKTELNLIYKNSSKIGDISR
jgi:hypothetical protein